MSTREGILWIWMSITIPPRAPYGWLVLGPVHLQDLRFSFHFLLSFHEHYPHSPPV